AGDCDPPLVCVAGACAARADDASLAADTEPPSDAAAGDAGVVFRDSFDDATPLPRDWGGGATGALVVERADDAPSAPNVLRALMAADGGAPAYLAKTMETPGAQGVACSFKLKLTQFGDDTVTSAVLVVQSGESVRLDVASYLWRYYGQFGADSGERLDQVEGNFANRWVNAELAVGADRTLAVTVDGLTRRAPIPLVRLGTMTFELGIHGRLQSVTLEMAFDDVVCTVRN